MHCSGQSTNRRTHSTLHLGSVPGPQQTHSTLSRPVALLSHDANDGHHHDHYTHDNGCSSQCILQCVVVQKFPAVHIFNVVPRNNQIQHAIQIINHFPTITFSLWPNLAYSTVQQSVSRTLHQTHTCMATNHMHGQTCTCMATPTCAWPGPHMHGYIYTCMARPTHAWPTFSTHMARILGAVAMFSTSLHCYLSDNTIPSL